MSDTTPEPGLPPQAGNTPEPGSTPETGPVPETRSTLETGPMPEPGPVPEDRYTRDPRHTGEPGNATEPGNTPEATTPPEPRNPPEPGHTRAPGRAPEPGQAPDPWHAAQSGRTPEPGYAPQPAYTPQREPRKPATTRPGRSGLRVLVADGPKGLERLPMLGSVIDHLGTLLAAGVRTVLGPDAEAHLEPPRSVAVQDFLDAAPPGAPVAVLRMDPWGARCIAVLHSAVAAMAVERLLGGRSGGPAGHADRGFTAIERAVLERVARDLIARNLAAAFAPAGAAGFALERMETDLSRVGFGKPAAPAIVLRASVTRGGAIGGIGFMIPYAALEPMRDKLSQGQETKASETDEAWRSHLNAQLPATSVRLRAVVEQRRVQTADLLQWQVGSKLALSRRHDEPIDVFCCGLLVLRGRIAEKDGRIALHIEERRLADDRPFAAAPPPAAAPADARGTDAAAPPS